MIAARSTVRAVLTVDASTNSAARRSGQLLRSKQHPVITAFPMDRAPISLRALQGIVHRKRVSWIMKTADQYSLTASIFTIPLHLHSITSRCRSPSSADAWNDPVQLGIDVLCSMLCKKLCSYYARLTIAMTARRWSVWARVSLLCA